MSRPRSGRGASSSAPRTGGGRGGVFVPTPKSDIFVALLGVALGAMVLGCLLLLLVLNQYGFQTKVSAVTPAPATGHALAAVTLEKFDTVRL